MGAQLYSAQAVQGHPRRWAILAVLAASEFLVELDTTIVNVALPSMSRSLGASTNALQWIVDAYTLVFAGLLLLAGALGDRIGRRRVLMSGLIAFAAGSLVASLSPDSGWLIGARALMGLAAALIMPTTLSIMARVFPLGERERAIGIWSAIAGFAFALGPTLGGALVQGFDWTSVFYVNLPIVAACAVACMLIVPAGRDEQPAPPDVTGAALSVAGLGMLLYAIIEAPKHGWGASATIAEFVAAFVLLAALFAWERRSDHPMLDLVLVRIRAFWSTWLALGLTFLAIFGSLFVVTQYLQEVLGYSALGAGLRVLPVPVMVIVATPLSLLLEQRVGTKLVIALGLGLTAAGLLSTSTMSTSSGYGLIVVGFILTGAGMGFALTVSNNAMVGAISRARIGSGAAVNNTALVVGSALGVAVIGSILSTGYGNHVASLLNPLPADVAAQAKASIAATAHVAHQLPGPLGVRLLSGARSAFVDGGSTAFLVAGLVAVGGACVALLFVPRRIEGQAELTGPADTRAALTPTDELAAQVAE